MNTYLIAYDLKAPEDSTSYFELIQYIKSFSLWAKPEQSLWLVKSSLTVDVVRTNIRQRLDNNDKLVVIDVTNSNWATYGISSKVNEWMQSNL